MQLPTSMRFVLYERPAFKSSSSTYAWSKVDSCFYEAVYPVILYNRRKKPQFSPRVFRNAYYISLYGRLHSLSAGRGWTRPLMHFPGLARPNLPDLPMPVVDLPAFWPCEQQPTVRYLISDIALMLSRLLTCPEIKWSLTDSYVDL